MKNYLKIGIVLLLSISLFSCEEDKEEVLNGEEKEKVNPVEFNDQSFNWNDNAELWYYNDDQYYDMNMFTGSLRVDYGLTGSGDWLVIEFYTPTLGTLSEGDYIVSDSNDEGTCVVDLSLDVDTYGQYPTTGASAYFTSGEVSIEGSGDTYTVTLDVTDEDGNILKGTFNSSFAITNVY